MKKIIILFCVVALLFVSLTSCVNIFKYDTWHPKNQPMTKWTADGIELYILNPGDDYLVIVDYGTKKMSYIGSFHQNYASVFSIDDVRESVYLYNGAKQNTLGDKRIWIEIWDVSLISSSKFKLTSEKDFPNEDISIPELTLPSEIIFTKVASDIKEDDIPHIEIDEQYSFCPAYRYGSQWLSDDGQITISIDDKSYCNGWGEVEFSFASNTKYYLKFFEVKKSAYLVKATKNTPTYSMLYNYSEEWECEYFEDHFIATVIRSEHYEPGHIITFTLV